MPKIDISNVHRERRQSIMLTLTEDCNLRCLYCYEPNKSRDRYISLDTAKSVVTEFMEMENEFDALEVDFFGGEPMLAFNVIRDLVDWFHTKEWRKNHIFSIGTNGTILTEEMKTWLIKNKDCVWVGISLDGNKTAHDINRSNSYDAVKKNLPFFLEHWPNQPVKMTISAETIPYVADSIIELEEEGIPFSANVVFENAWGAADQKAELLNIYAQQLDRLVEYYVVRPELIPARVVDVKPEFTTPDFKNSVTSEACVRWCGAGHEMSVIEVDGSRSPCHRFSPWITGRSLPPAESVNQQSIWKPEQCARCKLIKICPVCAGFNWQENGDSGIRTTYHCEFFKLEAQASAKLYTRRLLALQCPDKLPLDEVYKLKRRVEGILDLVENGI